MLQNRIVRALVGVVFTKAAVAAGWYLYQKSLKDEAQKGKNKGLFSDDVNALDTKDSVPVHDLGPALDQVADYLKAKEKAISQKTTSNRRDSLESKEESTVTKVVSEETPKRVRRVVKLSDLEPTTAKTVRKSRVLKTPPTVTESTATKTAEKKSKKGVATKPAAKKATPKKAKVVNPEA